MGVRSNKQKRATLNRIVLDTKTERKAREIMTKQYMEIGRKIPKKLLNETATMKDMERYMSTLRKAYDRKIEKEEIKHGDYNSIIKNINNIQAQRREVNRKNLEGYDSELVEAILDGRLVSIGRDTSISLPHTKPYTIDKLQTMFKHNSGKSFKDFLNKKLKNAQKQLERDRQNGKVDEEYLMELFESVFNSNGYTMSEKNKNDLLRRVRTLDYLESLKTEIILETKVDNDVYLIYKDDYELNDNAKLMDDLRDVIGKSRRTSINQRYRIIT